MLLAVAVFIWTLGLAAGDEIGYTVVCVLSGLTLGVDLIAPGAMLNGMLSTEVRRLMLLDSSAPYAAQIVEPLYVSNQPSTPDLVRDFGVGVVGWALAGAFLVVLYSLIRAPQRR